MSVFPCLRRIVQWDWSPVPWQHSFPSHFFKHLPWLMITMVDASIMTDLYKCRNSYSKLWLYSKIPFGSDLSGLRTPIVETYWNSTHSRIHNVPLEPLIHKHPCGIPSSHPRWLPQSIGNGQSMDWRVWNACNKSPKTLCSPAMVCRCPGRVVFQIEMKQGDVAKVKKRKDS